MANRMFLAATAAVMVALATGYAQDASAPVRTCAAATPKSCIGIRHSWDPYPGWWEDVRILTEH